MIDADGATVIGQVLGTPACGGYWLSQTPEGKKIDAHRTQRAARAALQEAWVAHLATLSAEEQAQRTWRATVAKARGMMEAAE